MVRRHPHVFAGVKVNSVEEGTALWNQIKMQEKAKKANAELEKRKGRTCQREGSKEEEKNKQLFKMSGYFRF